MRVIQLVAEPLGQMAVSFKARPGDTYHHMEAVSLHHSGKRLLSAVVAFLRHGHVAFEALTRGERVIVHRLLNVRPALPLRSSEYKKLLVSGEDDEKPFICGDCGKRHSSSDDVKRLRGSLVCATDCGVLAAGRRYKRPVSVSELASSKRATAAPGLLREEPMDVASFEQTCEEQAAPIVVQAVLTSADGGTSSVPISEDRCALDATNSEPPAIDERNAGCYPPPHLPRQKGPDARGLGSAPYVWYLQMTGRAFDGETASYQLARNAYKARRFGHGRESQSVQPNATTLGGGGVGPSAFRSARLATAGCRDARRVPHASTASAAARAVAAGPAAPIATAADAAGTCAACAHCDAASGRLCVICAVLAPNACCRADAAATAGAVGEHLDSARGVIGYSAALARGATACANGAVTSGAATACSAAGRTACNRAAGCRRRPVDAASASGLASSDAARVSCRLHSPTGQRDHAQDGRCSEADPPYQERRSGQRSRFWRD